MHVRGRRSRDPAAAGERPTASRRSTRFYQPGLEPEIPASAQAPLGETFGLSVDACPIVGPWLDADRRFTLSNPAILLISRQTPDGGRACRASRTGKNSHHGDGRLRAVRAVRAPREASSSRSHGAYRGTEERRRSRAGTSPTIGAKVGRRRSWRSTMSMPTISTSLVLAGRPDQSGQMLRINEKRGGIGARLP